MTDDLEPMGGVSRVEDRYATGEKNPLLPFLERYLRGRSGEATPGLQSLVTDASYASLAVRDAHAAVLGVAPDDPVSLESCASFLSKVYCVVPDRIITYDLPIPLDRLGAYLPRGKMLINKNVVGKEFGHRSRGIIVNMGVRDDAEVLYGAFIDTQPNTERPVPQWAGCCRLCIHTQFNMLYAYRPLSTNEVSAMQHSWYLRGIRLHSGSRVSTDFDPLLHQQEKLGEKGSQFPDAAERLERWLSDVDRTLRARPERFLLKYQGPKRGKKRYHIERLVLRELLPLLFEPEDSL